MRLMREITGCDWHALAAMSSRNAAAVLGLEKQKGRIAKGCDADLVVCDNDLNVLKTFCRGSLVYDAE